MTNKNDSNRNPKMGKTLVITHQHKESIDKGVVLLDTPLFKPKYNKIIFQIYKKEENDKQGDNLTV